MKLVGTALAIMAAGLALFVAAMVLLQDRLLYLPTHATVQDLARGGLRAWPSAEAFRGLLAEPAGAARATVVVFHGNAGHAGHRAFYARALVPLGLRVILAEHPGYGPRAGRPSEAGLVSDAEETIARAHRQYGDPLLLMGESLGAAVAAAAGARHRDVVVGLLLVTPWDTLAHVASAHFPWLPVKWMLRDRYDNVAALATFDRPVVVAVAERDHIVPARFGIALHAALAGPKRLVVMPGSGHNDWPGHVDAAWWEAIVDFLLGPRTAA